MHNVHEYKYMPPFIPFIASVQCQIGAEGRCRMQRTRVSSGFFARMFICLASMHLYQYLCLHLHLHLQLQLHLHLQLKLVPVCEWSSGPV
ncbi:hypothetical protein M5D96_005550 [Drosophila gunungcola]|uniref:Uncharacterized protein n=1 Tax=Drosophila gunungcola TaxID=103775 RepID=A0A9P9YRF5_9MUSC|nr:hypothetical protein M5D96_005550 [Drosophila gunungcola]